MSETVPCGLGAKSGDSGVWHAKLAFSIVAIFMVSCTMPDDAGKHQNLQGL